MNSDGENRDFTATMTNTVGGGASTVADGDDTAQYADVYVEATTPGSCLDLSRLSSTVDTLSYRGDKVANGDGGHGLDFDRTPSWDPSETSVAVETTLSPSGTAPVRINVPRSSGDAFIPGFEILGELGHGGMGVVYKARQVGLKRLVAIKMLRNESHGDPTRVARMEIEAEAVARLRHPNIVRVHMTGVTSGTPYIVFELLEGGTLKQRLAGNPQLPREAALLLSPLARAINAAHRADILHRDLKPSNILFDDDGTPKIGDFGLAKRLEIKDGETRPGQLLGTPGYMAPEQAAGWDDEIGPAADIYSLGAVLYEMLTGRPPLKGTSQSETIRLVLSQDPPPPSRLGLKIPFDLETICLKAIAREPGKRYATAEAMADDLDRFLAGEPIRARRTPVWERGLKMARKRPVVTALLLAGLIATGVVAAKVQNDRARELARQASERTRVDGVLQEALADLGSAEAAYQRGDLVDARRLAATVISGIDARPHWRLNVAREKADALDRRAQAAGRELAAIKEADLRLKQFDEKRDESLFLDSAVALDPNFGGLDPAANARATCETARAGLEIFGQHTANADDWTLGPVPPSLAKQRGELIEGFYELLMVLADGVTRLPGGDPTQHASDALRILDQARQVHPTSTRAYHERRAVYLAMKGHPVQAEVERLRARQLKPADTFDLFLVGRDAMKNSEWRVAIDKFESVIQRQPDHFWARCLQAICYFQREEISTALTGLSACLQDKPDAVWLYLLRGLASTKFADIARGLAAGHPELADSLANAAAQRFQDADNDYRKAVDLLDRGIGDGRLRYALLVNRGIIALRRNDLKSATADLVAAIAINPAGFEALSTLGKVYQTQGRCDDALEQFTLAIQANPEWSRLYHARADVLIKRGKLSPDQRDKALADLEQAIERAPKGDPGIAEDQTARAELLRQAGRLDEALAACEAAIACSPRFADAHRLRCKLLFAQGRFDRLIVSCEIAIASTKPSAELFRMSGMGKEAIGDFAGAIDEFTRALPFASVADKPLLLRRRGWVYLSSEAYRLAEKDFDEALRILPNDADALVGRGLARVHSGLYSAAIGDAESALKLAENESRIVWNAARTYSQASLVADAELRKSGPVADRLLARYQDKAFSLVRRSLRVASPEMRTKLIDSMASDPALRPIQKRLRSLVTTEFDRQGAQLK